MLFETLKQRIEAAGPLCLSDYMVACVGHYYATRDPFGAAGDFTTAPEISQIFGELIGAWAADLWMQMGKPAPFTLAEAGPGRGTLMADGLRATQNVQGFQEAAQLHLIETSPHLRATQEENLSAYNPHWHDDLGGLPSDVPVILIANELLDALPIEQFLFTGGQWHRRRIGLDDAGTLVWVTGEAVEINTPGTPEEGDIWEDSPARTAWVQQLADRISAQGGAALLIDYGHAKSGLGDTLQALSKHKFVDALSLCGESDLTSHVDFESLAAAVEGKNVDVFGVATQGAFLEELGIRMRGQALAAHASSAQQAEIGAAIRRLTAPDGMGKLFKVLAMMGRRHRVSPAGFLTTALTATSKE